MSQQQHLFIRGSILQLGTTTAILNLGHFDYHIASTRQDFDIWRQYTKSGCSFGALLCSTVWRVVLFSARADLHFIILEGIQLGGLFPPSIYCISSLHVRSSSRNFQGKRIFKPAAYSTGNETTTVILSCTFLMSVVVCTYFTLRK